MKRAARESGPMLEPLFSVDCFIHNGVFVRTHVYLSSTQLFIPAIKQDPLLYAATTFRVTLETAVTTE